MHVFDASVRSVKMHLNDFCDKDEVAAFTTGDDDDEDEDKEDDNESDVAL